MKYRIVVNEQTGRFRVERRGLLGWSFVIDEASGDYLTFVELADAEAWLCDHIEEPSSDHRRWRVVSACAD